MDFRPDFPPEEIDLLRAQARNAMILLDLENCAAGLQSNTLAAGPVSDSVSNKIEVIFDGVDTSVWRPHRPPIRQVAGFTLPEGPIVTYVSRGLESMRVFRYLHEGGSDSLRTTT